MKTDTECDIIKIKYKNTTVEDEMKRSILLAIITILIVCWEKYIYVKTMDPSYSALLLLAVLIWWVTYKCEDYKKARAEVVVIYGVLTMLSILPINIYNNSGMHIMDFLLAVVSEWCNLGIFVVVFSLVELVLDINEFKVGKDKKIIRLISYIGSALLVVIKKRVVYAIGEKADILIFILNTIIETIALLIRGQIGQEQMLRCEIRANLATIAIYVLISVVVWVVMLRTAKYIKKHAIGIEKSRKTAKRVSVKMISMGLVVISLIGAVIRIELYEIESRKITQEDEAMYKMLSETEWYRKVEDGYQTLSINEERKFSYLSYIDDYESDGMKVRKVSGYKKYSNKCVYKKEGNIELRSVYFKKNIKIYSIDETTLRIEMNGEIKEFISENEWFD